MRLDTLAVLWLLEHAIRAYLGIDMPESPADRCHSAMNPFLKVSMIDDKLETCIVNLMNGKILLQDA